MEEQNVEPCIYSPDNGKTVFRTAEGLAEYNKYESMKAEHFKAIFKVEWDRFREKYGKEGNE